MVNNLGFEMDMSCNIRKDACLFGEAQSRVVVSVSADKISAFENMLSGLPFKKIGTVSNGSIKVFDQDWGAISEWKEKYDTAIEKELK